MSPFDYLNSINTSKKDIMSDDLDEKDYAAFVINRTLSYFNDTVLMANEMNLNAHLEYYGYSKEKAYQVLSLINKEHLDKIHSAISKGGKRR